MRLAVGTVQFGLDYGISNRSGRPSLTEAGAILEVAQRGGIRLLDTAVAYGDSEAVLGSLGAAGRFDIVTKTAQFRKSRLDAADGSLLRDVFHQSLARLGTEAVYGVLVHLPDDLLAPGGEHLYQALMQLKHEGKTRKIGVSVYTPSQIEQITARYNIDLIQVPVNVFDQRLLQDGSLAALKRQNVEIHARSAFLQGLLLMEPDGLDSHFNGARQKLARFRADAARAGTDPLGACLQFALGIPEIDQVVVGVNRAAELAELIARAQGGYPNDMEFADYAVNDEQLLMPSRWPAAQSR